MNQLTQSVTANSEESASVAEELSSQAQEVLGLVHGFKLTASRTEREPLSRDGSHDASAGLPQ